MPTLLRRCRRFAVPALLLAATAAAKPPVDPPDNLINDRFSLQAGIIVSSSATDLRHDSTQGTVGSSIDAERDLGLPGRKMTGFAELAFRMKERHRIRINDFFLPLDRHATHTLTNTYNFGDTTYNVNDVVNAQAKVQMFGLSYGYSFIKNDRVDLAATLGARIVSLSAEVAVPARLRDENVERSTPIPLAGLDATLRLSRRWYLEGRFEDVHAHVSDVRGTVSIYQANVLYRRSPNLTFGLGYNGYRMDVDIATVGDSGHFTLHSAGPQLFVRAGL